jgi:hypothetical protein
MTVNNCDTEKKHLRNIPSQHKCVTVLCFFASRKTEMFTWSQFKEEARREELPVTRVTNK